MKDTFKIKPLTNNELITWKSNPDINPRTNKKIKLNGFTYNIIQKIYNESLLAVVSDLQPIISDLQPIISDLPPIISDLPLIVPDPLTSKQNNIESKILNCIDDRDPISMTLFWNELNGKRTCVYSKDNFNQLVFFNDSKNFLRCLEKESLKYLKTYKIFNHPINNTEQLPNHIFEGIDIINNISNEITLDELALNVFQYFSHISIFIDYNCFLSLNKKQLLKFNYELREFWLNNFNAQQRSEISHEQLNPLLLQTEELMSSDSLENIQKYLLNQLHMLFQCKKEEYKYMINYIILGALGIVIPSIKEQYPDFSFSF